MYEANKDHFTNPEVGAVVMMAGHNLLKKRKTDLGAVVFRCGLGDMRALKKA